MKFNAKTVLYWNLLFFTLFGVVDGYYRAASLQEPGWLSLLLTVLTSFSLFYWYYRDSEERNYPRNPWLSIGMVALSVLALPYYLCRSRPQRKWKVLWKLVGYTLLTCILGLIIGGLIGAMSSQHFTTVI
jgi:hypothetical protein